MMRPRHFFLGILLALLAGLATAPVWAAEAGTAPGPGGTRQAREIVDQNLFHPSRREALPPPPPPVPKPTPPPAPPPPPPPPPPKFALYGVLISGSEPPQAFLKEPQLTQDKLQAYPLGSTLGDYRLTMIEEEHVIFSKGDQSLVVLLHDPAKPKGPLSPAAVPPPSSPVFGLPAGPAVTGPPPGPAEEGKKQEAIKGVVDAFKGLLERGRMSPPGAPPGQ